MNHRNIKIAIVAGVIAGLLVAAVLFAAVINPKIRYQKLAEPFKYAAVGDTVKIGTYEQDNDQSNGKEDIEWLVLSKEDDRILVISKYALDYRYYENVENHYHDVLNQKITWDSCDLCIWLNDVFFDKAFSKDERQMIISTTVTSDRNPEYDIDPGSDTQDRVFLLSIDEANKYFASDEARKCAPTDYAIARGVEASDKYLADGRGACLWWLRTPGSRSDCAAYVLYEGGVSDYGCSVFFSNCAVRPAMWINLGK